ncbi:MAG: gliding motility-associated C-terminal domain-containing protein [Bacteroidales bacterium]|nr:gliding motility-associated C-terminal domain-containing protein [Bacteroidales bacterium]
MMNNRISFNIIIFSFIAFGCFGQVPVDQPEMPVMYKVTVNPVAGHDTIIWYSSTEGLVDYYAVCYSKITNPNQPYILSEPIDSIYPPDTVYVNQDTESGIHSIGYSVIAVNIIDEHSVVQSVYDYPDSTVYADVEFDSCNAAVTIRWNPYNKWKGHIASYRVYQSVDNGPPQVIAIIDVEEVTSFKVMSVTENSTLGYYVEIIHEDRIRSSTSNMAVIYTGMLEVPDFIVGHSANEGADNHIILDFSVDPDTELSEYKLLRSSDISGDFDTITSFRQHDTRIMLTDDVDYTSGIYYYKLMAINNCGQDIQESNVINNIILTGTNDDLVNHLSWNPVEDWPGETGRYVLYRTHMNGTGQTDSVLLNTELNYSDDVSAFFTENNVYSGRFCYQIRAVEINNPFTQNSTACSNEFCINVTPGVRLPNAFIPNNPNGVNSLFQPVFRLQPAEYEMTIFNRWGNKIWEGNIPWDGTVNNKYVSEGVYIYQLKVFYPDNTITLSGHITVLYR